MNRDAASLPATSMDTRQFQIHSLDHVQFAVPSGGKDVARGVYSELLGLKEGGIPAHPPVRRALRRSGQRVFRKGSPMPASERPATGITRLRVGVRLLAAFAVTLLALFPFFAFFLSFPSSGSGVEPCRIEVLEKGNGWPVPLVELRTLNNVRFVTDNAGVIAFDLPDLMGRETWFDVIGHGYDVPKDGFGMRGVRLTPEPGKTMKLEVHRSNIAKRLGRLTGGGLFAESQKLGQELDWRESGILGCDTVENAVYRGKLFWLWGDTILPGYPLGIFDSIGATTPLQPVASFVPPLRPKFDYFASKKGALRAIAKMPGDGPTWVSGCISLRDKNGGEQLVGAFVKVHGHLDIYQCGLCVWNDAKSQFDLDRVIWTKSDATPKRTPCPEGHPVLWKDPAGKEWALFGDPFPKLRCPATFEAWEDPTTWETLRPQETVASAASGKPVKPHTGAIAWNPWRKRWVTVFMEELGHPSPFGELWYAEADAPTGPWGPAVKILTHENYTFYNPTIHPEFTAPDSPILVFEGTYTAEFANHAAMTPRYNYNQILYRLDLDDAALAPAHSDPSHK